MTNSPKGEKNLFDIFWWDPGLFVVVLLSFTIFLHFVLTIQQKISVDFPQTIPNRLIRRAKKKNIPDIHASL